ncbi:MAG: hypothetical protein ACXVAY_17340 [Mucilaginibacter sp.]
MDNASFPIYEPDGQSFHLTNNWIVFGLLGIDIVLGYLWSILLPANNEFRSDWQISYFLLFFLSIYYFIASYSSYEPLTGTVNGQVKFEKSRIIVDKKPFELQSISNLDFRLSDFYGKKSIRLSIDFNPRFSQGVNNYVSFLDSNNEDQGCYFQLKNEQEFKSLSPFINEAIKLKKMDFKQGIDLLGIENVSL